MGKKIEKYEVKIKNFNLMRKYKISNDCTFFLENNKFNIFFVKFLAYHLMKFYMYLPLLSNKTVQRRDFDYSVYIIKAIFGIINKKVFIILLRLINGKLPVSLFYLLKNQNKIILVSSYNLLIFHQKIIHQV